MDTRRFAICTMIAAFVALGGCAASPEEEHKREEMEADIDDILSQELDPLEYGERTNCLYESQYRSYGALGTRHLLFEGRQGKLWVNVLRGRCPGLAYDSIFIIEPNVAGRLCDKDRFSLVDRMSAVPRATMTPTCVLGEFRPVTQAQVEEVENRLEMR